ncbi:GNAT family N-acetyltransferase [Levilactobacillus zymae]|uniref:GNAT family N-acetyltransferase n=1 Tax=Levilactobacillus zymae TaxID=267363 RepID=UPI0028B76875|nr:GNAT family N-acetyltransferase [Levilactobacillus zymae]MDT6981083.1 GNAT family N-acetyltransferase [Levilactobacillus zymae]
MVPEITTARLHLRPLKMSDLEAYQAIVTDPRVALPAGLQLPLSDQHVANGLRADLQQPLAYAITRSLQGPLVGMVIGYEHADALGDLDVTAVDLGYFLTPTLWGHGYMPEALRGLLAVLVQAHSPIKTLWATSLATNQRSQNVLSHLSFELIDDQLVVPNPATMALERHLLYRYDL